MYAFQDNYSLAVRDGKYGIIDLELNEIIPPVLDNIHDYDLSPYFFDGELFASVKGKSVVYDTLGHITRQFEEKLSINELHPHRTKSASFYIDALLVRTESKKYSHLGSYNLGCLT